MVFDGGWGGGRRRGLLSMDPFPNILVKSIGKIDDLGGRNIDNMLLGYVLARIKEEEDEKWKEEEEFIFKLCEKLVNAKVQLSE